MPVICEPSDSPPPSPLALKRLTNPSDGLLVFMTRLSQFFLQRQHRVSLFCRPLHQTARAATLPREKLFHPANAFRRYQRPRTLFCRRASSRPNHSSRPALILRNPPASPRPF